MTKRSLKVGFCLSEERNQEAVRTDQTNQEVVLRRKPCGECFFPGPVLGHGQWKFCFLYQPRLVLGVTVYTSTVSIKDSWRLMVWRGLLNEWLKSFQWRREYINCVSLTTSNHSLQRSGFLCHGLYTHSFVPDLILGKGLCLAFPEFSYATTVLSWVCISARKITILSNVSPGTSLHLTSQTKIVENDT